MKHILIIDDAATVRLFLRDILEAGGYGVSEAINGIEALEKSLSEDFDLYLVDINMPKLDGYGFLHELRARDQHQVPAIMISTEEGGRDRALAYAAGANHYLIKPVRPEILLAAVGLLLGESQPS